MAKQGAKVVHGAHQANPQGMPESAGSAASGIAKDGLPDSASGTEAANKQVDATRKAAARHHIEELMDEKRMQENLGRDAWDED